MPFPDLPIPQNADDACPSQTPIQDVDGLLAHGLIAPGDADALRAVAQRYAVKLTPTILLQINRDDPLDPIGRQFIPHAAELAHTPEERTDPIGDHAFMPVKGLVHRYPDRVLLKPVHVCPVYCRFCFRREMVGPGGDALSADELQAAYRYIIDHREIFEVIITGGDPLMLSPRRLSQMVAALSSIDHVGVIRVHSRVPIVDPGRISDEMVAALQTEKGLYLAVHTNHARELGAEQAAALRRLNRAGVVLLGQTVLLRGVNDRPDILEALFRRLVTLRVKPYYLHQGDLAPGTAEFRTKIETGQALMRRLRGHVSGLCQPTYVLDLPGGYGKVPIGPTYACPDVSAPGRWLVTDYQGKTHFYSTSHDCDEA